MCCSEAKSSVAIEKVPFSVSFSKKTAVILPSGLAHRVVASVEFFEDGHDFYGATFVLTLDSGAIEEINFAAERRGRPYKVGEVMTKAVHVVSASEITNIELRPDFSVHTSGAIWGDQGALAKSSMGFLMAARSRGGK